MSLQQEQVTALEKIGQFYPQAGPSLVTHNSFEGLVAVLLSAQTTDKAVNQVTPALFKRFPNPASLAASSITEIESYLRTLGLYRNKARYLLQLSQKLVQDFNGKVPQTLSELTTLPGVGRKTASVVLADQFDIPAFAVDTHVSRIAKRLKLVGSSATPYQIEQRLTTLLPPSAWIHTHHAMISFGREICVARHPHCQECPLKQVCPSAQV